MSRRDSVRANVARWRNRQAAEGFQRLDVYIPPELWAKLEPKLTAYSGPFIPGAPDLIEWLRDVLDEK